MEIIKTGGRFVCFLWCKCSNIQVLNCIVWVVLLRRIYNSCFQSCWNFMSFYTIFTSQFQRKLRWSWCKNSGYCVHSGLWPESCPNWKWPYFVIPLTNSLPRKVNSDGSRRLSGALKDPQVPPEDPLGSSRTLQGLSKSLWGYLWKPISWFCISDVAKSMFISDPCSRCGKKLQLICPSQILSRLRPTLKIGYLPYNSWVSCLGILMLREGSRLP